MTAVSSHKKALWTLFMVVATELIGFGLIIPILPQLGFKLHVPTLWVGFLMAAYSAAQFIAAPLLGQLSDRIGRRPVLLLSKLGTMIGYFVLAASHSFGLFLLSRLIDGFTGGNISVARAYIADITTPENRPKGMAVIGIAFGVGFIFGPALGGFLYPYGQALPALVAAGFSGIALILTYFFLPEPEHRTPSHSPQRQLWSGLSVLKAKWVPLILGTQLIYMLIFAGFETTFAVFTQFTFAFNEQQNSWLFVFAGLMTMLVQGGVTRRIMGKPKRMLLIGLATTAAAFALLSSAQHLSLLLLGVATLALGMGLISAYLPAIFSTLIPNENQGSAMGVYEGLNSLCRVFGPILAFGLFSLSIPGTYSLFAIALALTGIVILLGFLPPTPSHNGQ